jgi:hypothetical protein
VTGNADDTDIDDYLASSPEAYLMCRAIGHAWNPTHKGWLRAEAGEPWRIELECLRCRGAAVIYPALGGGKFDRRSVLVKGYYVKGARLSRNEVRTYLLSQAQENPPQRNQKARK